MKIVILGFTKTKYTPYLQFYLNQIDVHKDEVHLVYWARDCEPDTALPEGIQGHCFSYPMSDALPLKKKVPGILKYGRFAKKILNQIKPDFLIVLLTTTAVSIYDFLMGKYKNRYIFDHRDVTYERNSLYRKMVENIVKQSKLSFTSSEGFRRYLPQTPKLLNSHNITNVFLHDEIADMLPRTKHTPIRVSYWGLLRNPKINEALIERLGGDERFELHYYGRVQGVMQEMLRMSTQKYKNVFFHGEYTSADRLEMAKNTDLIHNIFDLNDKSMPIAMSNKYYDGPLFGLPQLCTKGSHMGSLVTAHGIGLECNPFEEDFADRVYAYYTALDEADFVEKCEKELSRVLSEVEIGEKKIREVLQNA